MNEVWEDWSEVEWSQEVKARVEWSEEVKSSQEWSQVKKARMKKWRRQEWIEELKKWRSQEWMKKWSQDEWRSQEVKMNRRNEVRMN